MPQIYIYIMYLTLYVHVVWPQVHYTANEWMLPQGETNSYPHLPHLLPPVKHTKENRHLRVHAHISSNEWTNERNPIAPVWPRPQLPLLLWRLEVLRERTAHMHTQCRKKVFMQKKVSGGERILMRKFSTRGSCTVPIETTEFFADWVTR